VSRGEQDQLAPRYDLTRVAEAHNRLGQLAEKFQEEDVCRESLLPGWTVGHVLTHLARNADSHIRRAEAAARGEMVDQYVGGYEGRELEISKGATRHLREIVVDVIETSSRLERVWGELPGAVWANSVRDVSGAERPLRSMPSRRWQEVEVHMVDLRAGFSYTDWPEEFVSDRLDALRTTLSDRLPAGARPPEPGQLEEREELAWLYGRLRLPGLPDLASWG
jgi:maleylpyruvate isomerase